MVCVFAGVVVVFGNETGGVLTALVGSEPTQNTYTAFTALWRPGILLLPAVSCTVARDCVAQDTLCAIVCIRGVGRTLENFYSEFEHDFVYPSLCIKLVRFFSSFHFLPLYLFSLFQPLLLLLLLTVLHGRLPVLFLTAVTNRIVLNGPLTCPNVMYRDFSGPVFNAVLVFFRLEMNEML